MKKCLSLFCSLLSILFVLSSATAVFAASPVYGVDVSYANGSSVSFTEFKNKNRNFVMIRLGYYNHMDDQFWNNVKKAHAAQIPFGVYLYSYAYSLEEAKIEAQFVLDTLAQLNEYSDYFVLPVAYDLEEPEMEKYGKTQITNQAVTFCDRIRSAGYTPMVYANLNWFNNYLNINTLKNKGYKFWYANWGQNTSSSTPVKIGSSGVSADIWQYTNSDSAVSDTDGDVLYDFASLAKCYTCGASFSASVQKAATCTAAGKTAYTCTVCKRVITLPIAKTAHKSATSVTPATTSKDGKITKSCPECKKTLSVTAIPKIKSVALSAGTYTYNGKTKKPSVTVKDSKGNKISSSNYTVSYSSGRKNVGQYTVTVKFKNRYKGTVKRTFTIKPKSTSISKVTAGKKKFTVKWKKQTSQTTGYQIQYSTSSKFKSAKTVTVGKNKTTSKSISKLKAKKKYYVRVRTYKTVKINGKNTKIYSSWSKAKSVTTKK